MLGLIGVVAAGEWLTSIVFPEAQTNLNPSDAVLVLQAGKQSELTFDGQSGGSGKHVQRTFLIPMSNDHVTWGVGDGYAATVDLVHGAFAGGKFVSTSPYGAADIGSLGQLSADHISVTPPGTVQVNDSGGDEVIAGQSSARRVDFNDLLSAITIDGSTSPDIPTMNITRKGSIVQVALSGYDFSGPDVAKFRDTRSYGPSNTQRPSSRSTHRANQNLNTRSSAAPRLPRRAAYT